MASTFSVKGYWKHKKLGRKAVSKAPTLKLSKYLNYKSLPPIPAELERYTSLTDWTMMGNDTYGDCTCAAAGHGIMAWTSEYSLITPSETSVLAVYTAVTAKECSCAGFNATTDANDNGCIITDVQDYWKTVGVDGHKIDLYTSVDITNHGEVRNATYLFGLLNIGLALPLTAQDQPTLWDVTDTTLSGNAAPGSWGGHDVIIVGYNATTLDLITWGERIKMTWAFWNAYVDEAYAILAPDWFSTSSPHHISPTGLSLAQLEADMKLV